MNQKWEIRHALIESVVETQTGKLLMNIYQNSENVSHHWP